MKVVLASASPRRKEIFAKICPAFEIIPAVGEEKAVGEPKELVKQLAYQKAREVADRFSEDVLVLGSDTVVALGDRVLGKPRTKEEAKEMLSALSGRTHEVFTGVCFIRVLSGKEEVVVSAVSTEVEFETLSKEQIEAYVATGSPMDKAGAYGIQDGGLVKEIRGSFTNVVGLPEELCRQLFETLSAND